MLTVSWKITEQVTIVLLIDLSMVIVLMRNQYVSMSLKETVH